MTFNTAMPGMFCEAMVTMNSGSAMLTMAATLNCGVTNSTVGTSAEDRVEKAPAGTLTPKAMTSTKATSAAGTA
ncbi:hypothetical protein D9M72_590150 [compost metagenome]